MTDPGSDGIPRLLQQWLARHFPGRTDISLSGMATPAAGASNETLSFDMHRDESGERYHRSAGLGDGVRYQ